MNPNSYYWQGNQPDLYAAFLFNSAGRPDLTQKWVRWVLEKKYGDHEDGIDGNDDGGTISAWYVWSSLGLFPRAGTDRYEICSPIWTQAEIQIEGNRLQIFADHADDQTYVKNVWLNEKLLERYTLRHEEIAKGGILRFEMSSEPNAPR